MTILSQGPDGALNRLQNMQDLVGKNLNNIVGNLWQRQEEGSGSSHGNMVSVCLESSPTPWIMCHINSSPADLTHIHPPLRNVIIFRGIRGPGAAHQPTLNTGSSTHRFQAWRKSDIA